VAHIAPDGPTRDEQGNRRPSRPPFARAAILTYGTNITVAALSLVNVLIVARALGPEGRGDVTFLITVTMITASLFSFGIQQASINYAAAEPHHRPALATNALIFSLVLGALGAATVALLIVAFPAVGGGESASMQALVLTAIPLMIARTYFSFLAQADYAFHVYNLSWLVGPVANVVVNGIMAVTGTISVGSAVGVWIGGQALGVALTMWYVGTQLAGFGRPDLWLARRSLRFGAKAHAGNVMLIGNYRLDQWILGSMAGARELGLYSVAVAWAEALFFLPTALAAVLRPDVVRDSASDAARRAAAVFRVTTVLTIPIAVAMVILAPFLCVTIFGEEFRGSIDDLRWLVPGGFGIVALKILGSTLTAQGKPMLETAAIGVAFVSTVALDVILIPQFGGSGAAVASSLAYLLGGLVACWIFVRTFQGRALDLVPRIREVLELGRAARARLRGEMLGRGA
jgi:O-antigen/teichoic acid export membrane protein